MIAGAFRQPEPNTVVFVAMAFVASVGAFSMMRPSPPREVPALTRGSMVGSTLSAVPERAGPDAVAELPGEAFVDEWEGVEPPAPDLPPPELVLIGTAVSPDPSLHTAIVRREGRTVARFHHVGDRIDGYVVEAIGRRELTLAAPSGKRTTYRLSLYPDGDSAPTDEPEPRRGRTYDEDVLVDDPDADDDD